MLFAYIYNASFIGQLTQHYSCLSPLSTHLASLTDVNIVAVHLLHHLCQLASLVLIYIYILRTFQQTLRILLFGFMKFTVGVSDLSLMARFIPVATNDLFLVLDSLTLSCFTTLVVIPTPTRRKCLCLVATVLHFRLGDPTSKGTHHHKAVHSQGQFR